MQLTVSKAASEKLAEYQGKNIRVYIAGAGWGGPRFGLALDEPKKDDFVFERNGVNFIVDKQLENMLPQLHIDYQTSFAGEGFVVNTGTDSSCDSGCC